MAINEVFPHPTVKQVIFQIRFPNLFFIESKIAEFQLRVMEKFPESELRYRKFFSLGSIGPDADSKQVEELRKGLGDEQTAQKLWTFRSGQDYELNVLTNSLDITSKVHKTYDLPGGQKFRDIISFVMDSFLACVALPKAQRIGLRYIDECPVPGEDNASFAKYYNSVFPLERFSLGDSSEILFRVTCQRGGYHLSYVESFAKREGKATFFLDFDGFAENVEAREYLAVTDALHKLISDEYNKTIREPVKEYMRKGTL